MNFCKPKLNNVILLRSFAICMVVLYHCYCPFMISWNWIPNEYSAKFFYALSYVMDGRMPLFIFISGYLFSHLVNDRGKYSTFIGFIKNKFKRLLVPCLTFMGIMCLVLHENYFEHLIGYGFHLWFLKVLFLCFITCWLLHKYINNWKLEVVVAVIAFGMMALPMIKYWALGQFFKKFIFFYLGYLTYKYNNVFFYVTNTIKGLVVLTVMFVSLCVLGWLLFDSYNWDPSFEYRNVVAYKILSIIGMGLVTPYFGLSLVNFIISHWQIEVAPTFFNKINNASYGIYLFHVLYLQIIEKYYIENFISIVGNHYVIAPLLLFLFILGLSIFSTIIIKKFRFGEYIVG